MSNDLSIGSCSNCHIGRYTSNNNGKLVCLICGYVPSGISKLNKTSKFDRDRAIRAQRKRRSIEKILKNIRKNKYNTIKTIEIDGKIYNVYDEE